jgi:uncharacterized cupredoxin-like copper-binding protein
MIRRALLPIPLLVAATAAAAQQPDWAHGQRVNVALSSFDFAPKTIRLRAGRPAILHLSNSSGSGHDFTAREFFAAAAVRPADRAAVEGGRVELKGHQSRDVALVPKAGRYRLRCSHAFHSAFGMSGEIVVE